MVFTAEIAVSWSVSHITLRFKCALELPPLPLAAGLRAIRYKDGEKLMGRVGLRE